ncbi:MAG: hypothetical protein ACREKS_13995 [Candidatus Rokuibacteriota bacterium]
MRRTTSVLIGIAALGGLAAFAEAQEEKAPISASLLINNVLKHPIDHRERQLAFDESLRRDGPPPRRSPFVGEVQPDGSVRYGDVVVSQIKNPCPPGEHVELAPPPLPTRRVSR